MKGLAFLTASPRMVIACTETKKCIFIEKPYGVQVNQRPLKA